jgi:hypothetical protein
LVSKKAGHPIAVEEVPRIFDAACIGSLAKRVPLPAGTDLDFLASDVREAAIIYTKAVRKRDPNELHHEIAALYFAAQRRQYQRAADLPADFSSQSLAYLEARLDRPGPRASGLQLPSQKDLLDPIPARRDEACEMVERIWRVGGVVRPGRKRQFGKRSRPTLWPLLHAPELRRHVPKRQAEREFVENLAWAWQRATGKPPARTANHRAPGPFVRFVEACPHLVGAGGASAVKLINEPDRRRR